MKFFFDKKADTKLLLSLLLLNGCFLIYYSILVFYNRLAQDDYIFLYAVREWGIIEFVKEIYMQHQGRFVSFIIQGVKYSLIEKTGSFSFVPVSVIIISVFSLYYFLSKIFVSFSKKQLLLISFLLFNILLIINFEFSSFFWIASCSSISLAAPLLLIVVIFYSKKKISLLYAVVLSIIIGGSSEAFSPLILFFIFAAAFAMLLFRKEKSVKDITSSFVFKKLTIAFCVITVCFLIVGIAPGNANRLGAYEQPGTLIQFMSITFKNVIKFSYLFIFKLPYILFMCFFSFVAGLKTEKQFYISKQYFLYSLIVVLAVIWFSTFPAAYAMSGFGFQRIYTPVIFWLLLYGCFVSFYFGNIFCKEKLKVNTQKRLSNCLFAVIIFVSMIQIFNIIHDTPVVRAYSLADQKRINSFLEEKKKGREEPMYFDALPSTETENIKSFLFYDLLKGKKGPVLYYSKTELYYSNDIEDKIIPNTLTGYSNAMIMQYYDLPFPIYLKEARVITNQNE